jgi:hypothetical protein
MSNSSPLIGTLSSKNINDDVKPELIRAKGKRIIVFHEPEEEKNQNFGKMKEVTNIESFYNRFNKSLVECEINKIRFKSKTKLPFSIEILLEHKDAIMNWISENITLYLKDYDVKVGLSDDTHGSSQNITFIPK